jgi:transposase-like protein
MEVVAGRRRPAFSRADRQRILQAADRCSAPGEIGALMRREGVYSSSLSTWRKQRKAAELAALAPRKRGPKPAADRDQVLRIAELTRDNDRLKSRLDKALFVIEVQKKVAAAEQGGICPRRGGGASRCRCARSLHFGGLSEF